MTKRASLNFIKQSNQNCLCSAYSKAVHQTSIKINWTEKWSDQVYKFVQVFLMSSNFTKICLKLKGKFI